MACRTHRQLWHQQQAMNGAVSLVLAAIAVAFATTHVVLAIKVSGQATVGAAGTRLAYLGSFAFDTSDHEAALAVLLSNASRSLTGTAEFEGVVTGFVGPANAPELLLVSESDDEPPLWDDLALLRDGEPSALTCAALRARAGRVHPLEAVAPPLDVYHMDVVWAQSRPKYWHALFGSCDATASDGSSTLDYTVTFRNPGGYWTSPFSFDEQWLYEAEIAAAAVTLLVGLRAAQLWLRHKSKNTDVVLAVHTETAAGRRGRRGGTKALLLISVAQLTAFALLIARSAIMADSDEDNSEMRVAAVSLAAVAAVGRQVMLLAFASGWLLSPDTAVMNTRIKAQAGIAALLLATAYCLAIVFDDGLSSTRSLVLFSANPLSPWGVVLLAVRVGVLLWTLSLVAAFVKIRAHAGKPLEKFAIFQGSLIAMWEVFGAVVSSFLALVLSRWYVGRVVALLDILVQSVAMVWSVWLFNPRRMALLFEGKLVEAQNADGTTVLRLKQGDSSRDSPVTFDGEGAALKAPLAKIGQASKVAPSGNSFESTVSAGASTAGPYASGVTAPGQLNADGDRSLDSPDTEELPVRPHSSGARLSRHESKSGKSRLKRGESSRLQRHESKSGKKRLKRGESSRLKKSEQARGASPTKGLKRRESSRRHGGAGGKQLRRKESSRRGKIRSRSAADAESARDAAGAEGRSSSAARGGTRSARSSVASQVSTTSRIKGLFSRGKKNDGNVSDARSGAESRSDAEGGRLARKESKAKGLRRRESSKQRGTRLRRKESSRRVGGRLRRKESSRQRGRRPRSRSRADSDSGSDRSRRSRSRAGYSDSDDSGDRRSRSRAGRRRGRARHRDAESDRSDGQHSRSAPVSRAGSSEKASRRREPRRSDVAGAAAQRSSKGGRSPSLSSASSYSGSSQSRSPPRGSAAASVKGLLERDVAKSRDNAATGGTATSGGASGGAGDTMIGGKPLASLVDSLESVDLTQMNMGGSADSLDLGVDEPAPSPVRARPPRRLESSHELEMSLEKLSDMKSTDALDLSRDNSGLMAALPSAGVIRGASRFKKAGKAGKSHFKISGF